ncbi:hypothetical protein ABPG72_013642 [Tetrahymena utriculariae]
MQEAQAEFIQGNLLFSQQYPNPNELERHNSSTNNNMYLSPNFVPACHSQISLQHRKSLCESSGKMSIENQSRGNLSNNFNPRQLDKNNVEEKKDEIDADNSEEHISLEKSFEKSPIFKKLAFFCTLDIADDQHHSLPQNNIQVGQEEDLQQEQFAKQEIKQASEQQRLLPLVNKNTSSKGTFLNNNNKQFIQNKIEEVVEQVFSSDQISVINNSNKSRSEEDTYVFNQTQQEEQNSFNQSIKTNSCFQNQQQKELEQHNDDISYHNIYEKMNRKKIKNNNEQAAMQLHQRLNNKTIKHNRENSVQKKEEKKQLLQTQPKNQQISQISNQIQQISTLSSQSFLNNSLFSSNNFQSMQSNIVNPTIEFPSNINSTLFQNVNTLSDNSNNYQRNHITPKPQSNKNSPSKMYGPFTFLQKSLEINQALQQNLNQVHTIETLNQNTFDLLKEKAAQNNIQYQPQQQQSNLNNYQTKDLFEPYLKMCNFYEPNDQIDQNCLFINHHEYTEMQEKPSSSKQRTNFLSEKNSDQQDQENFSEIESVSSNPNNTKSYISSQDDIDDLLRLDDIDLNDFSDVYCKQHNYSISQSTIQLQENNFNSEQNLQINIQIQK